VDVGNLHGENPAGPHTNMTPKRRPTHAPGYLPGPTRQSPQQRAHGPAGAKTADGRDDKITRGGAGPQPSHLTAHSSSQPLRCATRVLTISWSTCPPHHGLTGASPLCLPNLHVRHIEASPRHVAPRHRL
jgi:hypothetical protein